MSCEDAYLCGMENDIIILDSVEQFNRQCGFETLHPLVTVVKSALKGHIFCGGVGGPKEIEGNPKLQEAFEMGKSI